MVFNTKTSKSLVSSVFCHVCASFTHRLRIVSLAYIILLDEHRLLSVCVPMCVWRDVREMSAESSFNRWLPVETWLNVQKGTKQLT